MNNIQARVLATALIWTAITVLGVAVLVNSEASGAQAFMLVVLVIGGTIGTGTIWKDAESNGSASEQSEKAKRRSRVERMMDNLDARDLDELRYRLMDQRDEQQVPLDELMRHQSRE